MGTYRNNVYHLCKRLEERFGIKTTNKAARTSVAKEIANLVRKAMNSPQKKFYTHKNGKKISNSRSIHTIVFRGIEMRVVYCKNKKVPITVLPIEEKQ